MLTLYVGIFVVLDSIFYMSMLNMITAFHRVFLWIFNSLALKHITIAFVHSFFCFWCV